MLVLGVGIEPGTPLEHLKEAVDALGLERLDVVATIDTRAAEPAVTALAARPALRTYPAAGLGTLHRPHPSPVAVPPPSPVVRRLTGTGSVAEAAALLAARELGGGELVVPKQRGRGVTVAVATSERTGSGGHTRPPGHRTPAHASAANAGSEPI